MWLWLGRLSACEGVSRSWLGNAASLSIESKAAEFIPPSLLPPNPGIHLLGGAAGPRLRSMCFLSLSGTVRAGMLAVRAGMLAVPLSW